MQTKITRIFTLISIASFIVAGSIHYWQRYLNPDRLSFSAPPRPVVPESEVIVYREYQPTRMVIPSLKIDLPVIESQIKDGVWPTSSAGVSYLGSSPRPGQPGNSIFYGHNWPRLLGSLKKIKIGDFMSVFTDDQREFKFQVTQITEVEPSDTSILQSSTDPEITIYTCSGIFDSKRLVVVAKPV